MITNVVESKYDGKPFFRFRSFFSFLWVCFSCKHRILIGLTVDKDGDKYGLNILYYGLSRGVATDIVDQFVAYERATSTNLESLDRRITTSD